MRRKSLNKPLRPNSPEVHTNDKNARFEKYNFLKIRKSKKMEFKHKWIAQ